MLSGGAPGGGQEVDLPLTADIHEEQNLIHNNPISPSLCTFTGDDEAGNSRDNGRGCEQRQRRAPSPDLLGLCSDEEVEQGRMPISRKQPRGLSPEELK